jgi:DNA helicase-2/ATP-dependent DNA helicase PcrA
LAEPIKQTFDPLEAPGPVPGGIAARARPAAPGAAAYLAGLNPEQRLAVETLDGPVLVLAGAGTGKTRVLTTRIAHILATGRARPGDFGGHLHQQGRARDAQRVGAMIGPGRGHAWLGTFHAIAAKILRRHAELVGLKANFTILDVDDQERLIKQLLEGREHRRQTLDRARAGGLIDGWKNRGLTPEKVPAGEAHDFANGKGARSTSAYQERLKILNAADFGDLLLDNLLRLFTRPTRRAAPSISERFKYILVDEYQDTNVASICGCGCREAASRSILPAQTGVMRFRERRPERNICCVGDDDQSIYGWRGAEVDNILRFEQDFPGAKVIRLERNYRSTGHILAAASASDRP